MNQDDIVFLHYLIGELEEHGAEGEITFEKSAFCNGLLRENLRGKEMDYIIERLERLGTVAVRISEEKSNDRVGKRVSKRMVERKINTQLLQYLMVEYLNTPKLNFKIPLQNVLKATNQFGRSISRDIVKVMFKKPRVYMIAYYIARIKFINTDGKTGKFTTKNINYETLIREIGEEERYLAYVDKKTYLKRLNQDIEEACKYLTDGTKINLIKPTVKTLGSGKIKIK